jgi:hypothetical protein
MARRSWRSSTGTTLDRDRLFPADEPLPSSWTRAKINQTQPSNSLILTHPRSLPCPAPAIPYGKPCLPRQATGQPSCRSAPCAPTRRPALQVNRITNPTVTRELSMIRRTTTAGSTIGACSSLKCSLHTCTRRSITDSAAALRWSGGDNGRNCPDFCPSAAQARRSEMPRDAERAVVRDSVTPVERIAFVIEVPAPVISTCRSFAMSSSGLCRFPSWSSSWPRGQTSTWTASLYAPQSSPASQAARVCLSWGTPRTR